MDPALFVLDTSKVVHPGLIPPLVFSARENVKMWQGEYKLTIKSRVTNEISDKILW